MKKQDTYKKALDFYKILAHPMSDKILPLLSRKEVPVREIYNTLKIEQSQCSVHLSKLRQMHIVKARKEGKRIFYSINPIMIEKADQACKLVIG